MWPASCAAADGFGATAAALAVTTVDGSLAAGLFAGAVFGEGFFFAGFFAAVAFAGGFVAEGFFAEGLFTEGAEGLATSSPFVDFSRSSCPARSRPCLAARERKSSLRNRSVHARIAQK